MAADNKSRSKHFTDIQMMITASAIALTLAFWNLFAGMAGPQKTNESAAVTSSAVQSANQPVKIYLGGKAPTTQVIVTNSVQSPQTQQTQSSAPAPVTTTKSS